MKKFFTMLLLSIGIIELHSQAYIPPDDPLVLRRLEQWQNLKFGLLMHWGPYSQWGIVESWSICSEDEDWCRRKMDNYEDYKREYTKLKETFNPVEFDPARWAEAARNAGMKYVIFTTKHHDGFCMFDSRYTDYKVTDTGCLFSGDPRANITKEIFDAFREQGLWVGPYFSKPDWHSEYYWWPNFATPDRHVNYKISRYPDRWEKFILYTHKQIDELMSDYGPIDILWLDGGWVRPPAQDIRMDEIVARAREKQPGLIVVDRAVPGINQNYLTPENEVPQELLPYPWESCIIAGGGWSWVPDARYKSPRQVIHLLADIVAKGGNLLLNIAPGPLGQWHDEAYVLLAEVGKWLTVNGEAIYETRPLEPYKDGQVCFTQKANGDVYLIYLPDEQLTLPPPRIVLSGYQPEPGSRITMLGDGKPLKWEILGEGCVIHIPKRLQRHPPCSHAWTLDIH